MGIENHIAERSLKDMYVAIILMKASSEDSAYTPLYEELIILIQSGSLEDASKKAHAYGISLETDYYNEQKYFISVRLKQVIDVNAVLADTLSEITDLYARHFKNYKSYSEFETLINPESQ